MRLALAALLIATTTPAWPTETTDGQIVCFNLDEMREFVKAIAAADRQWRDQIKTCVFSLPGSKMAIIDRDVPAAGIPHVAKVRIFKRDGADSVLGYAVLEPGQ